MTREEAAPPVWTPSAERIAAAHMSRFLSHVAAVVDNVDDRTSLWRWSIEQHAEFWRAVWDFTGIAASRQPERPLKGDGMLDADGRPATRFFPGARLNFAENLLRHDSTRDAERPALIAWTEHGPRRRLSHRQLADEVAACAAGLRAAGVERGDRVAGFLPNGPEAVIAMLATASLGAVWSSCSPDFGATGVLDRFGQIGPRVVFTADGYRFGGKDYPSLERIREVVAQIPEAERLVVAPVLAEVNGEPAELAALDALSGVEIVLWDDHLVRDPAPLEYHQAPFDHPLYILYSSGTTGLPKCMVHGAGGTLIQHLKELVLHTDIGPDDKVFYFTTTGWMMWNWLVSSLATGAAVVLYDGSPFARDAILWDLAEEEGVTVFGTSAKYLAMAEKKGLTPRTSHDLGALRTILSTGSPLLPASYDYVYRDIADDVLLASISGGTDIVSCFALGDPTAPVYRGELQARGLGMSVEVFDAEGRPQVGAPGELVCTRAFPSMPVRFWNDPDGAKYRAAYFEVYPDVWRHGDWAEITPRGGLVIHGRSDATLNPGGVRIGTAEIYRQVEQFDEVLESLVVGQRAGDDVRIVLFVRLRDDLTLDDALRERIRRRVRENASPFHVPKVIAQVADLPRTRSGKITEMAVRDILEGREVANVAALANPEALDAFRDHPELAV
ncbi:MAG: acetoacetate--CoA ligase [Acidobacteriota bacterium]